VKTDSLFYSLFQSLPSLFFELIGQPASAAAGYRFASVEVKQTALRVDGVFLPPENQQDAPVYFVEVQFQRDAALYRRLFAEVFLYLKQYPEVDHWRAIAIYPRASVEVREIAPFRALLESSYVQVIYLDQLGDIADLSPGLGTLRLLVEPVETVPAAARELIERVQQSTTADLERNRLVELIETIVVYTFPRLSRQEVATMLGLTDMRETRVYQEGREEEAKFLILKQLTRKLGAEPPEALQQQISQLPLDVLESLGEALFDFNQISDLRTWLEKRPEKL
jgi:predicted transposase/invertase (TIGR01784 family)